MNEIPLWYEISWVDLAKLAPITVIILGIQAATLYAVFKVEDRHKDKGE